MPTRKRLVRSYRVKSVLMRFATGFDKVLMSRLPIFASLERGRRRRYVVRSQHMFSLKMNEGDTILYVEISVQISPILLKVGKPAECMVKEAVGTHGNAAGAIVSAVQAADVESNGGSPVVLLLWAASCDRLHYFIAVGTDLLALGWDKVFGQNQEISTTLFLRRTTCLSISFFSRFRSE